jgi:hypothetical protein
MSRMQQVIETLEAERQDLKDRLSWIEEQIKAFREHNDGSATQPSGPRRSSSSRRARRGGGRRNGKPATADRIVDYLGTHPNSTAGDLAKALKLKRNSVSTKLTQMAKDGKIKKAQRGYTSA